METLPEDLKKLHLDKRLILFVGARVSVNLGLPSWSQLIDEIALQLEYDPDIYRTFGNDYSLAEYYRINKKSIGSLRSYLDVHWHSADIKIEESKIHEYIVKSNFKIIYTTNYDRWIEKAFTHWEKEFVKIKNVSDILDIDEEKTQIIKFHGDFDDDSSIVIDESGYYERLDFETPLDIKLRSDTLGKSVLFIGYSLNDINMRVLFFKLAKLWKNSANSEQPTSFIFMNRYNPVQEAILGQWGIKMLYPENTDPGQSLEKFLNLFQPVTT